MRALLSILILSFLIQACSQAKKDDEFVWMIENLRKENLLTTKTYPEKTFVGSLTGYYDKGTLVLMNSLTDAEEAGTETSYYIKDGRLTKVYIMDAKFDSHAEWAAYFRKHQAAEDCDFCHGTKNCTVTVVNFDEEPTVEVTKDGQSRILTGNERTGILSETSKTSEELTVLLRELK